MKIGRLTFVVLGAFAAVSCSTERITIEVMKPSYTQVDTSIVEIGLGTRVDFDKISVPTRINGNRANEFRKSVRLAGDVALETLQQELQETGRYAPYLIKYGALPLSVQLPPDKATTVSIDKVCKAYRLEGLIVLESYEAHIDSDGYATYSSPVDRNYGTVQVPVFHSSRSVDLNMFWRFYSCEDNKPFFEQDISTDYQYQTQSENPYESRSELPSSEVSLLSVSERGAKQLLPYISPFWVKETRSFYAYGTTQLVEAANLAREGYWSQATDIWFELTKDPRKSIAKKAVYNMILASEVAGDYELAKSWANTAIEEYKDNKAVNYLQLLNEREKELDQIDAQFPSK